MNEDTTAPAEPAAEAALVVKLLSRSEILTKTELRRELVSVPEWGGSIYLRALRADERDEYEQSLMLRRGKTVELRMKGARARLIAACAVDSQGNQLFDASDAEAIGNLDGGTLDRLYEVASKLSGLRDEDVEELTGN